MDHVQNIPHHNKRMQCHHTPHFQERTLYHDLDQESGFLLNVDPKWRTHPDCHSPRQTWHQHSCVKDLYCLAMCNRRDVHSLRDLQVCLQKLCSSEV